MNIVLCEYDLTCGFSLKGSKSVQVWGVLSERGKLEIIKPIYIHPEHTRKEWHIYICGCGFSEAKSCKHTYPCHLTVVFSLLNISEQFSYQLAQHVRGKIYVSLPHVPVNHLMAISIHLTMPSPISAALVYLLSTPGVQVCNNAQVLNITTMARHITRHDMYVF